MTHPSKHTPGPWVVKTYPNERVDSKTCVEANRQRICLLKHTPHYGNVQANARLIAAAPELLEALKECLPEIQIHECYRNGLLYRIEKAIAKAEGRE